MGKVLHYCGKRHWCLFSLCLLFCGAGYVLYWEMLAGPRLADRRLSFRHNDVLNLMEWEDVDDLSPTSKTFTDFIDPDQSYLRRMFYSSGLVKPESSRGEAGRTNPRYEDGKSGVSSKSFSQGKLTDKRPPAYNVTLYHGQPGRHYNTCVPFHAPGNRTLKICVYDKDTDQMISSYIQDYGVWEKEQVDDMAYILQHEDRKLFQSKDRETLRQAEHNVYQSRERKIYHEKGDFKQSLGHQLVQLSRRKEQENGRSILDDDKTIGTSNNQPDERLTVVDIGCNLGVYTLAAASLGHQVIALDPVESNLQLLDTSLRMAGLRSRVTLLLNAVSNIPGPVTVNLNSGNLGGSSISQNKRQKSSGDVPTMWAVCMSHLTSLVPTRRVLLKLDIEGWEARALRCASLFFQQLDVSYVLMEWLFHRKGKSAVYVIDFMIRNGLLPYSDIRQRRLLSVAESHAWPDNVWWIKR